MRDKIAGKGCSLLLWHCRVVLRPGPCLVFGYLCCVPARNSIGQIFQMQIFRWWTTSHITWKYFFLDFCYCCWSTSKDWGGLRVVGLHFFVVHKSNFLPFSIWLADNWLYVRLYIFCFSCVLQIRFDVNGSSCPHEKKLQKPFFYFFFSELVWCISRLSSSHAFVNQRTCKSLKAIVNYIECLKENLGPVYFLTVSHIRNSPADISADWAGDKCNHSLTVPPWRKTDEEKEVICY